MGYFLLSCLCWGSSDPSDIRQISVERFVWTYWVSHGFEGLLSTFSNKWAKKPRLLESSLQYFPSSQFWGSAEGAPKSDLQPLSWKIIKIPRDFSGGSKSRTILKSFLFYSFRSEQASPSRLFQSLKLHGAGLFLCFSLLASLNLLKISVNECKHSGILS